MKKCVRCGTELEDNVKFCGNCGAQVPSEQQEPESGTAYVNEDPGKVNPNFNQNRGKADAALNPPGSGQALASMICGIAGILLSVPISAFGLIFGVVAIILGVLAKKKLPQGQAGFAIAGFVTGIIGTAISLIIIIFVLVIFAAVSSHVPPFLESLRHLA